jgi:hypothetical protein
MQHRINSSIFYIAARSTFVVSWLSVRPMPPPPPGYGGRVGRFGKEQAHADQLLVVVDALDRVPVQLKLGHDGCWEVNPAGVQFGESDGLVAGLAQALEQPLLLGVSKRHRRIVVL